MKRGAQGIAAARKKKKLEEIEASNPLKQGLLSDSALEIAKGDVKKNCNPFPHIILENFGEDGKLKAVFDQALQHLTANLKESDTFKLYETETFADLKSEDQNLSAVKGLRDALYREDFRGFVAKVFDTGPLLPNVDCVASIYNEGCHFLCHSDAFIETRKLAFLMFLAPEDEPWHRSDGGTLELFETDNAGAAFKPSKEITPKWNTMVLFEVQPGTAYHAISEIFNPDKTQLIVSGFFHSSSAKEGAGAEVSVPQSLGAFTSVRVSEDSLTDADLKALSAFVSESFLARETISQLCSEFENESQISLHGFLLPEVIKGLRSACCTKDEAESVGRGRRTELGVGVGQGWVSEGPSNKRRYLRFLGCESDQDFAGQTLSQLQKDLFESEAFLRFLSAITGLALLGSRSHTRRFRPGLDFSIAAGDDLTEDMRLDAAFCVVDEDEDIESTKEDAKMSADEKRNMWGSSLIGGYLAYVESETQGPFMMYEGTSKKAENNNGEASETVAAEQDDEEEDGPLAQSVAKNNSLFIALRDQGVARFAKYVGGVAPGSRWDIQVETKVDPDNYKD